MSDNNFTTLYKTWTADKLLDIVDCPNDYQPLAVEAARLELGSRQLTQEQLANAKAEQDLRRQYKSNNQQKVKNIENKIKSIGSALADNFNPIQNETPTTDKYIKFISLFLGGLFLYQLYKESGLLMFMLTEGDGKWDFSTVLYFLPFIVLPTAAVLFWLRKKFGWTLATLFLSYMAIGAIPIFLSTHNRQPTGNFALDTLFPVISPTVYVGTFLLFGGATLVMCKENIREVYGIDRRAMFITIGLVAVLVLLMMIGINR